MITIKNRVTGFKKVDWRTINWFQNNNLKDLDKAKMEKLKRSFIENDFAEPFNLWEKSENELYFLDGHHRQKAMQELEDLGFEGEPVKIPKLLPANIIKCKNETEAGNLVLVYSSIYANVDESGLSEFISNMNLNLDKLNEFTSIPDIDLSTKLDEEREKDVKITTELLKPFNKTHVLLSFPPEKLIEISVLLEQIKNLDYIEYEQSSN